MERINMLRAKINYRDNNRMVIHTPTIEDYITVINWCLDQKITWATGNTDINEDYWDSHREKTCIVISDVVTYCSKGYVINNYNKDNIINMAQFYEHTKNKFGLKFDLR